MSDRFIAFYLLKSLDKKIHSNKVRVNQNLMAIVQNSSETLKTEEAPDLILIKQHKSEPEFS